MNSETATSRVTEEENIDRMVETGMVIASDGMTRRAYICAVCGQQHGAHQATGANAADRRVGNCDLCGTHSHLLYPVSCWGGLRGASGLVAVLSDSAPTHYGMADAARMATAGHSTQQAARSCDESAKPGKTLFNRKRMAQVQREYAEHCKDLAEGLPALNRLQLGSFREQANVDVVAMLLRSVAQDLLIAATRNDIS